MVMSIVVKRIRKIKDSFIGFAKMITDNYPRTKVIVAFRKKNQNDIRRDGRNI